jgi:hypothetical protein
LFGTKENLQIAVAGFARDAFAEAVVRPAFSAQPGTARLRALVEAWIVYAETPLFPGGCFWAANLADFDSRPGPVRDVLAEQQREWRGLLATELRHAGAPDPELAAFQLDAVLVAANTALRLGEKDAVGKVRQTLEAVAQRSG